MTIAFDALTFMPAFRELSVDSLQAQIRASVPADVLHRPFGQLIPAARSSIGTPAQRLRTTPEELAGMIYKCLHRRSCDALEWHGSIIVVARSGLHTDLLRRLQERHAAQLIACYADATSPCGDFHLAGFGDHDAEGDICWDFARGTDTSVLVLCEFAEYGDWWRPVTAMAEPLLCRHMGNPRGNWSAEVVYRVRSRDVLHGLWSRTSHDDAIARYCAPGNVAAEALLDAAIPQRNEARALVGFARDHGWIYTQRYGGGAGEHYALFAAGDPQLTRRVYEHAVRRADVDDGWWAAGVI